MLFDVFLGGSMNRIIEFKCIDAGSYAWHLNKEQNSIKRISQAIKAVFVSLFCGYKVTVFEIEKVIAYAPSDAIFLRKFTTINNRIVTGDISVTSNKEREGVNGDVGEQKPELDPELKLKPSPESKLKTRSKTEPETKIKNEPGTKIETKLETKPETKLETEPETKLETKPGTKIETKPETKLETEPETKLETEPETKLETEPETKLETEPKTKLETKPETKLETKSETNTNKIIGNVSEENRCFESGLIEEELHCDKLTDKSLSQKSCDDFKNIYSACQSYYKSLAKKSSDEEDKYENHLKTIKCRNMLAWLAITIKLNDLKPNANQDVVLENQESNLQKAWPYISKSLNNMMPESSRAVMNTLFNDIYMNYYKIINDEDGKIAIVNHIFLGEPVDSCQQIETITKCLDGYKNLYVILSVLKERTKNEEVLRYIDSMRVS